MSMDPHDWPKVTIGDREYTVKITWGTLLRAKKAGVNFDSPIDPNADSATQVEAMAKLFAVVLGTKKDPIDWEELAEEIDATKQAELMRVIDEARKKVSAASLSEGAKAEAEAKTSTTRTTGTKS